MAQYLNIIIIYLFKNLTPKSFQNFYFTLHNNKIKLYSINKRNHLYMYINIFHELFFFRLFLL